MYSSALAAVTMAVGVRISFGTFSPFKNLIIAATDQ